MVLVLPGPEIHRSGKLERYWRENYCLAGNKNCVRYKMEQQGEFHPDNMLPNGEIRKDL
ncbi:MAG: uracil-DNA glycosylase [Candidatus Marinimicrobia bacterium]|nr:uracil-DNA glycosylase [Candidatus Neomarinimicrobiota bacterium]